MKTRTRLSKKRLSLWALALLLILGFTISYANARGINGHDFNLDICNFTGSPVNGFEMYVNNMTCSNITDHYERPEGHPFAGWRMDRCETVPTGVKVRWRGPTIPPLPIGSPCQDPSDLPHFGLRFNYDPFDTGAKVTNVNWLLDGDVVAGLSFETSMSGQEDNQRVEVPFRNTGDDWLYIMRLFRTVPDPLRLADLNPGGQRLESLFQNSDPAVFVVDTEPFAVEPGQLLDELMYQTVDRDRGAITRTSIALPDEVGNSVWVAELVVQVVFKSTGDILTQGYSTARTNAYLQEKTLTPANINSASFGKLYSRYVQGRIYAQPLYVEGVSIPGQGTKNVIYIATTNNKVYAFDADETSTDPYAGLLWQRSLPPPAKVERIVGETAGAVCRGTHYPNSGITGTPVISKVTNRMYLVTHEKPSGFEHQLYALDISSGNIVGGPVPIQIASFPQLDSKIHLQRSGLLLRDGSLYIAFGGACGDAALGPPLFPLSEYHGWIFRYKASDLTLLDWFITTPTPHGGGGIWQSGSGPVVGGSYIYVQTGNGHTHGGGDYSAPNGDSIIRLPTNLTSPGTYQQPHDEWLAQRDLDLASAGPLRLPNGSLVGGGKEGLVYLFNSPGITLSPDQTFRATWNTFNCPTAPPWPLGCPCYDHAAPSPAPCPGSGEGSFPHIHSRAFWNNRLYVWGEKDYLRVYNLEGSAFNTNPVAVNTALRSADPINGGIPRVPPMMSISANWDNPGSGIVWALRSKGFHQETNLNPSAPPATLYAFNAEPSGGQLAALWNSDLRPEDSFAGHPRFTIPTVAGGKVYVATFSDELVVYGLRTAPPTSGLPPNASLAALTRDKLTIDLFAIGNDGNMYSNHYTAGPDTWSGFAKVIASGTAKAPPGAPIAAIARDANRIDLFYVDNSGQIQTVWWDAQSGVYHNHLIRTEPSAGGRSTAPPGSPVSAVAMGPNRMDVFVVNYAGRVVQFKWTSGSGWNAAAPISPVDLAPLRTPVTATSHDPGNTMEIFLVGHDGSVWRAWCDAGCNVSWNIEANFAPPDTFPIRTPISAVIRQRPIMIQPPHWEDLLAVNAHGRVLRAWWDTITGSWTHPNYLPFGLFSSLGMIFPASANPPRPRTVIAGNSRTNNLVNLLAVNTAGAILTEFWETSQWNPAGIAWGGWHLTNWQVFMGAGTATANSTLVMVGGVPNQPVNLDLFWIRPYPGQPGRGQVMTRRQAASGVWGGSMPLN